MSQHSVLPKRKHDSRLPLGCDLLNFYVGVLWSWIYFSWFKQYFIQIVYM